MEGRLQTAQEAAVGFASRLRPEDMAEIINFDSRVEILETFTGDQQRLERAIRQTSVGGSTSLYNAIYISLKGTQEKFGRRRSRTCGARRSSCCRMVRDTSSLVGFDEVLEQAKRSETAIYSIGLRSRDERSRRGFKEADFVLCGSCPERPGVWRSSRRGLEISPPIYEQISEELSNQYTLGYTSEQPTAGRHVAADRRSCHSPERLPARTKQGYYAPRVN